MSVLSNTEFTFDANYVCVSDVTRWFLENGMLLNPDKTKSAPFGTRVQRAMVNTAAGVEIAGVDVPFSNTLSLMPSYRSTSTSFEATTITLGLYDP